MFHWKALFTFLLLLLATVSVYAAPWFDLFFNSIPETDPYSSGSGYRSPKSGKERYKQLCRVLNADNYAFPDKVPYPAAPLCPY